MKIAVKEAGKELQIIETTEKYRTACVKEYTGEKDPANFIKLSPNGTFSVGVNENGLHKKMPINFLLEMLNPFFPIQKIVGTAVFVRCKPVESLFSEIYDYEVDNLTDDDISLIHKILDSDYQQQLELIFEDYGNRSTIILKP